MKVAVCIPTYNQAPFLEKAVASVLAQTWSDLEVWVSDDASTDETAAVMQRLAAQDARIHYVRQRENQGISKNVDSLMRLPSTKYLVRLDSDDVLNRNFLEVLVPLIEKHPQAGVAHANVEEIDQHDRKRRIRAIRSRAEYQDGDTALKESISGYRVAANICLFRREALQVLNFFASRPEYTEDYDCFVSIADAGYGNVHSSKVLSQYRVWTDKGGMRSRRKATELRGLTEIFEHRIEPAFRKRGWDLGLVIMNRRKMALIHADYLAEVELTSMEAKSIVELLHGLGASSALKIKVGLIRLGFGIFYRVKFKVMLWVKDYAKRIVGRPRGLGDMVTMSSEIMG